ncbi:MAG: hypothetical protein ACXABY_34165 [Candidatus Thorarchaeota archaeon]|jgi:hypothetical protein
MAEAMKAEREAREASLAANPCNKCEAVVATKEFDHEPLCLNCVVDRLIETVERLKTIYATARVEIGFDYETE